MLVSDPVVSGPGTVQWTGVHLYDANSMQNLASREYKYTGIDLSPVALYLLHPYWNFVVELVPRFIAANLLTVIGGLCFTASYFVMFWDSLAFEGHREWWRYAICAAATFAYQTLDGIDGKQARRTKNGSPLGEMLDHGVDVLWTVFGATSLAAAAQVGTGMTLFAIVFLGLMLPFFVVTWESYHTHRMVLGYINGPTEGLLLVTGIFAYLAVTGEAGEQVMAGPLVSLLQGVPVVAEHVLPLIPADLSVVQGLAVLLAAGVLFQLLFSFVLVTRAQLQHGLSVFAPLRLLLPVAFVAGLASYWVLAKPEVFAAVPHRVLLMLGMTLANQTVRLIVGHLMNRRPSLHHLPTAATVLALGYSLLVGGEYEESVLLVAMAGSMVYHLTYMVLMVRDFVLFLNIPLFRVRTVVPE